MAQQAGAACGAAMGVHGLYCHGMAQQANSPFSVHVPTDPGTPLSIAAGEIGEEYEERRAAEQPVDDLMGLVEQIVPYDMTHNAGGWAPIYLCACCLCIRSTTPCI